MFEDNSECNICASKDLTIVNVTDELRYKKCNACGHHLLNSVEASLIKNHYFSEQKKFYDESSLVLSPMFKLMEFEAIERRHCLLKSILTKPMRVLEIGPGNGKILLALKNMGHNVFASEQSETLTKNLRFLQSDKIYFGEFEASENIPKNFESVISFHVIEHVVDPQTFIKKAYDVAQEGGTLVLATPNASSWHHRFPLALSSNYDSAHLHVFSEKSLRRLVELAGWKVTKVITPSYSMSLPRLVTSFIRKFVKKKSSVAGGAYVANFNSNYITLYKIYSYLSLPFRKFQELFGVGNEIILIARK